MTKTATCQLCKRDFLTVDMVKLSLARRGDRSAFLCDECKDVLYGYHSMSATNYRVVGKPNVNRMTYGLELETMRPDLTARIELFADGFIPTRDCTVDAEFVSPIYNGLQAPMKHFVTIERLMRENHLDINTNGNANGSGCGTHFHVGNADYINAETISWLKRFYHTLFVPLSEEMQAHPAETTALFGRNFTYYAREITRGSYADAHENWVNLQHSKTVEFRLPVFRNAEQYAEVARFCDEVAKCLINNFIKHFNDKGDDRNYRLHKAQVTANKLVKIYKKYAGV